MNHKPRLVCASDLRYARKARAIIEEAFDVVYVDPTFDALHAHLAHADAYYAALQTRLTSELIAAAPRLRAVVTPSTGTDHIDLDAAARHGIVVLDLKDDRALLNQITATAELAWALLLACARRLYAATEAARQGHWARDGIRGHQIAYKTLGILGCGRLGSIVAGYGQAFRMKVIAHDPRSIELPGVEMVSFDELFDRSDIVSIHIHLTEQTRQLVGREELNRLGPGAILVNTSRGAIVDEDALLDALRSGRLAAAGLDVINGEWKDDLHSHPLIAYARTHDNLIITPHVGGATYESQETAYSAAAAKLVAHFQQSRNLGITHEIDGIPATETFLPHFTQHPGKQAPVKTRRERV